MTTRTHYDHLAALWPRPSKRAIADALAARDRQWDEYLTLIAAAAPGVIAEVSGQHKMAVFDERVLIARSDVTLEWCAAPDALLLIPPSTQNAVISHCAYRSLYTGKTLSPPSREG